MDGDVGVWSLKRFPDGSYLGKPIQKDGIKFIFQIKYSADHRPIALHFDTVIKSDIHWGTHNCRGKLVRDELRLTSTSNLYLLGDIPDGQHWETKDQHHQADAHVEGQAAVIGMAEEGTKVTYLFGNHDEKIKRWVKKFIFGIEIAENGSFTDGAGLSWRLEHGHGHDAETMGSKQGFWYWIGDKALNALGILDRFAQSFPRWKDCSPSAWCKRATKFVINNFLGVRKTIKQAALNDKLHDGQINGHSHMWEDTTVDVNEAEQSKTYKGLKFFLQKICSVRLAKVGQTEIDQTDQSKRQKLIRYIAQDYFGFYLQDVPTKIILNSGCSTENSQTLRWDCTGKNRARFQTYTDGFDIVEPDGQKNYFSYEEFGLDVKALLAEPIKPEYMVKARRLERIACRLWPSKQRQEALQRVAIAHRTNNPAALDSMVNRSPIKQTVHAVWKASKNGWVGRQEIALKERPKLPSGCTWREKATHAIWKKSVHILWNASETGWLERQESIRQQAHDIAVYGRVPPPDTIKSWPARARNSASMEMTL